MRIFARGCLSGSLFLLKGLVKRCFDKNARIALMKDKSGEMCKRA